MKKILGLDLGTNSIGWALIHPEFKDKKGEILGMGSRIIPMTQDRKDEFGKGNSISQTADRTGFRGTRRLRERYLLRRERLHRILNVLGFLPEHYANQIDFKKRLGKFSEEKEPKIAYKEVWNQETEKKEFNFVFKDSFEEMLRDFREDQPQLLENSKKIPFDWTIYYLRKKALTQKISKEELAWIILNFNQKRGYYQLRGEEDEYSTNVNEFVIQLKIVQIDKGDRDKKNDKKYWFNMTLENGWVYSATFSTEPQWLNTEKEFLIIEEIDDEGNIKIVKDKRKDVDGREKRRITPLPTFEEIDLMSKKDQDKIYKKIKAKTEITITNSGKTVGTYIYNTLLKKPNQKINGKLIRTIERKFYKEELKTILEYQLKEHPELQNTDLFSDCIRELYRNNEAHQTTLSKKDFVHLFLNDIIFYQRPLKSQKSSIGNCSLEYRKFKDADGNEKTEYLKVISKSNPIYQEFRIWQWLYNLKIYRKEDDTDVTEQFIKSTKDLENLFEFLMTQKEVNHKDILNYFISIIMKEKFPNAKPKILKDEIEKEIAKYRWNYVFDDSKEKEDEKSKRYPCNETGYEIRRRLAKVENIPDGFLTSEIEQQLWHIIYSVTDIKQYETTIENFINRYNEKHQKNINEEGFKKEFIKFPPFKSEYGSFSEKAIKKLLPLLRLGKYWSWNTIDVKTKERITKIITGEYDEKLKTRVREKAIHLTTENDFQGLQLWLAQYVIYDRHSEASIAGKWNSVADLENYLEGFKQHSLRNPIVEQVITETLRVVKDIWNKYGNGAKDFFDEIHIELGREMKNTADDRKRLTNMVSDNEATNLRIKSLLIELKDNSDGKLQVEEVRPFSPPQQEILKIYEDGVLNSNVEIPEDILKISKTAQPSKSELQRYKLWLEQKYRSPYTGQLIPMSKLFTHEYEIEHIIPQSRFFDDSFSNKVICESAVNKLKDKQLGLEFIKNHQGTILETGFGKNIEIFSEETYKEFIKEHYGKNRSKKNKLLLEEIPDKMVERQLNDTRYISKFISNVLSNIVRADNNDDGVNSKNILPGNGKITSDLKQDWGLNDVWNELILPRFERMNQLTNSKTFTTWNKNHQKFLPTIPLEFSKGFQKKRIDHRHHAMDALVIACATRDHINFMNNEYATRKGKSKEEKQNIRYDLRSNLCFKKYNEGSDKNYKWIFNKPWDNFTKDTKDELDKIVISFKQNLRVINKTTNKYESYKDENSNLRIGKDGKPKKDFVTQTKGDSWAIRKPIHKDTVSGLVSLRKKKEVSLSVALDNYNEIVDKDLRKEILSLVKLKYDKKLLVKFFKDSQNKWNNKDISRIETYYWENDNVASRVSLDTSFNEKRIVETITDTGIQKILLAHLKNHKNRFDEKGKEIAPETLAFTPEGIDEMNKNIVELNNGKSHQPILKVRTYEPKGNKFKVGQTGNKKDKFVEAAKGTNLFFAIYQDENGKKSYETIPLNIIIERQKQGLDSVPETNDKGNSLLFYLSPNDLVYVPTEDEKENINRIDFENLNKEQFKRIYKVEKTSGVECYFIRQDIAYLIKQYDAKTKIGELESQNKLQTTMSNDRLKISESCIKLKINRLGSISKA
ncbi:type II CRISPR RNA-guided endonuclease Cas9 [Flavobacterium gawalongense]|uniref:CRISPR-associated endonuclease Cas9 n=1 Tax=Flavobacterium gawalongense TaxID=2594432 RepID=A0A553BV74_9FLAO|nr:type II CRISPR RNA-guided endonuclease Cas9 [Flavobacterium gawalongense]TRX12151.1 type II CRISPR RNA-guided endonuclease Cas9 [Flavobacterium gawalongense]